MPMFDETRAAVMLLGLPTGRRNLTVRQQVRTGFPASALETLQRTLEVDHDTFFAVVDISRRTARRRIDEKKLLTPAESDRLYRVARIYARAVDVFEDDGKARSWLLRSNTALGGETPLSLLDTDVGIRLVEVELGRIDHGVYS